MYSGVLLVYKTCRTISDGYISVNFKVQLLGNVFKHVLPNYRSEMRFVGTPGLA
jgi:hypothetical protein